MKGFAFLSGLISGLLSSGIVLPAFSQVTSDSTTNTTVKLDDNKFNILNGIQKDNNLFHSFKEFSIPTGSEATFNNPTSVMNIINRVTGGSISNIDGLIKANGNANLFLINPAGIVFGENASLDIGGSFFGSTASSILFKDGFEFSAVNPENKPLLTVSVPVGLQMGTNPGAIQVKGNGHNLITQDIVFAPYINPESVNSLQVKPGKSLTLVAGDITLDGGILNVKTGRVELSSVREGKVNFNQINQDSTLGNIQLSQKSLVDAGAGEIQVNGSSVSLEDGSVLLVQNQGLQSAGDINVNASESLEINGISPDGRIRSGLANDTFAASSGNINIVTPRLIVQDGGGIGAKNFGFAQGGNISLDVSELIAIGGISQINPAAFSAIASITLADGKSGDIFVSTKELSVLDGAAIAGTSFSSGNGGNISINAQSIEVKGSGEGLFVDSTIASSAFGKGDGGSININTGSLTVDEDASINTTSNNSGNASNITIFATESVRVINKSSLESNVLLPNGLLQIIFNLPKVPSGNGGNVTINTPLLLVTDEGKVNVSSLGTGDAGILKVNADLIKLDNLGRLSATTAFGEGGDISLRSQSLQMRRESIISTSAGGAGNGGNITINTDTLAALENSDISANAENSFGGKVLINAEGIFGTQFREKQTDASDITASSQLGAEFNGLVELNTPGIDSNLGVAELPTNVIDSTNQIEKGCAAQTGSNFVVTGRGGMPQNPTQSLYSNPTWSDIRDLSVSRKRNNNIVETTEISNKPAIVEATGFIRNEDGEVELVAVQQQPLKTKQVSNCSGTNT